jgi:hypothetical protein
MKSVILNVRISPDLRNKLEKLSIQNEVSTSDIIRDILNNHFDYLENEESDYEDEDYLYHSNQFLFLVTWMFEKKTCCYDGHSERDLLSLKNTVINAIKEQSFPSNLKLEFEKVLVDLVRYIKDYHSDNNYFRFCKPDYSLPFDYNILINYISSRAFENTIYL